MMRNMASMINANSGDRAERCKAYMVAAMPMKVMLMPKRPVRTMYLGPILSLVFPQNGAVGMNSPVPMAIKIDQLDKLISEVVTRTGRDTSSAFCPKPMSDANKQIRRIGCLLERSFQASEVSLDISMHIHGVMTDDSKVIIMRIQIFLIRNCMAIAMSPRYFLDYVFIKSDQLSHRVTRNISAV